MYGVLLLLIYEGGFRMDFTACSLCAKKGVFRKRTWNIVAVVCRMTCSLLTLPFLAYGGVQAFATLLTAVHTDMQLEALGELMYQVSAFACLSALNLQ